MDKFSVFHEALLIYRKLQQDDPEMDIRVEGLEQDNHSLHIEIKPQAVGKSYSLNSASYMCEYEKLPTEFNGVLPNTQQLFQGYLKKLLELKAVTIFKQYEKLLIRSFYPNNKFLALTMAHILLDVEANYHNRKDLSVPIENAHVKLKISFPAKICVYFTECSVSLSYEFNSKKLSLRGLKNEDLVSDDFVKGFPHPVLELEIEPDLVLEHKKSYIHKLQDAYLLFDSVNRNARTYLRENYGDFETKSMDDILDEVIKKLAVLDVLDALQNVVLDSGVILLCFDPVLTQDDMDIIVTDLKMGFPQVELVGMPGATNGSDWWVVEVSSITDAARAVSYAGVAKNSPEELEKGTVAKQAKTVMNDIANSVNVDAAISASTGK